VHQPVLVVRLLMSRSQLLPNSWLYSVCHINCSVPNTYQLTNACLSGLEPLILCNSVTARGWPVNDWQWHDWCKYSYALHVSVCVYTASQFCWLQCSLCNGMNVNASLLPALEVIWSCSRMLYHACCSFVGVRGDVCFEAKAWSGKAPTSFFSFPQMVITRQ
jgi:hypothetical protein